MWHNCLATSSNLRHRGITSSGSCLTCLHEDEDALHIFRYCPLAIEAWDLANIQLRVPIPQLLSISAWLEFWIGNLIIEDGHNGSRLPTFLGTLWAIWKTRNHQIFRNVRATLHILSAYVQESDRQHQLFMGTDSFPLDIPPAPNEVDPPGFLSHNLGMAHHGNPEIMIQLDGSWDAKFGTAGLAWVVHVSNHCIYRKGLFFYALSALHTEAQACLQAIRWARENHYQNILLNTDSVLLVQYLRSTKQVDITIQHTLASIKAEAAHLNWCCLLKVSRQQVQMAHSIATTCRHLRTTLD